MKTVSIQLNCGEKTCASEPGKFCQYLGSMNFGTYVVCMLFPMKNPGLRDQGATTPLRENAAGWIARCDQCLEATTS